VPPQRTPPPPATQPRTPEAIGAQLASATAAPAGLLAAGAVTGALTAAEVRAITRGALAALRKLSRVRLVAVLPIAQRHASPVRPGITPGQASPSTGRRGALELLALDERRYEATFRRKQLARIQRDLPRALAQPTDAARRRRLEGLIGRETHYTRLRMDAIAVRAVGIAESLNVEERSPEGAVWQLGRTMNHTPGCLLLHGRVLAWSALRSARYVPPVHLRCDCRLAGLDEAVERGIVRRRIVPTVGDSLLLIAAAKRLEGDA